MDPAATPPPSPQQPGAQAPLPSLGQAARVWARIGLLSFGGPAGQIALMHREIVAQRGWVGERRFLHALSFCALLPGPEAQQLATYLGWLMHGVPGALMAGGLFILPGACVLLGLSFLFLECGQAPAVSGLFLGLQCAVLAIVVQAMWGLAARALPNAAAFAVAASALIALSVFALPFPAIIAAAAAIGAWLPGQFGSLAHERQGGARPGLFDRALESAPSVRRARAASARAAGVVTLILWIMPVAALRLLLPGRFADIALFFSKMAVVTFGGAYAVLSYVAQDAVHAQHWLTPAEMLTGLGLAETTPGPLILVLQFVGFLAGARAPAALTGLWGGVGGAALTLWVTFLPCFTYVFLGAPEMERVIGHRLLAGALAGVSASVVGIIANLSLWFAAHVLFDGRMIVHLGFATIVVPDVTTWQPRAVALACFGAFLVFGMRQSGVRTLCVCALAGVLTEAVLF